MNLAKMRAIAVKLADPEFRTKPQTEQEADLKGLLEEQGLQAPVDLGELLTDAQDSEHYQQVINDIDQYEEGLITRHSVESVLKLAFPLGAHCPLPGKLAIDP